MTDMTSLTWSRARAASRRNAYRMVFAVVLVIEVLAALLALFLPDLFRQLLGFSPQPAGSVTADWLSAWAGLLLALAVLQLPAWLGPIERRLQNAVVIVGRFALAVFVFTLWPGVGGGFLWISLFIGASALALYILFRRLILSELQTRP